MRRIFEAMFILLVLAGCSSDEAHLCETGPVGFTFEVVDQATGENLFVNGSYEVNQIDIKDSEGENVKFNFETERSVVNVLLGWESKSDFYTVTIGGEIEL